MALVFGAALEGLHASIVNRIRNRRPALYKEIGAMGFGYYSCGGFLFNRKYIRFLLKREFLKEFSDDQTLQFMANIEYLLFPLLWIVIGVMILYVLTTG
jgi:hypothetical protein